MYVVKHERDDATKVVLIRLVNAMGQAVEFPVHVIPALKRLIVQAELQISMLDGGGDK